MEKTIVSLWLMTLASCGAAGLRSARVEGGSAQFEEGGLGSQPTLAVGYLFQDDLPPDNVASGWIGDLAVRGTPIDEGVLSGTRLELDVGTRLYPETGSRLYQPFLGVGGTLQRIHLDDSAGSVTAVDVGLYGVVGVEVPIGKHARLGLQYRHTVGIDARLDSGDPDTNLDAGAVVATLGWSF